MPSQQTWSSVTPSPLTLLLFSLGAALIVTRLYQRIRWADLEHRGRDPVCSFPQWARRHIKSLARNRCEHHYLQSLRCLEREKRQATHNHPHSRGSDTALTNVGNPYHD